MSEQTLKKQTIGGFFWKTCERTAAQLVSLVVTIVLARILMPEDYAPVTLLAVFITIANVFITEGFCSALIQKKDVDSLDYSSVLIIGFVISSLLYIALFFTAPFISEFYKMPILTPTLRVMALRLPLAAINSVEIAYLTKNMRFRSFFWGTFIGTVLSGVAGILAAIYGLGAWSLVIQNLTNYTIDTLVLFAIIHKIPKPKISFSRLKPLFQFGSKILVNSLIFVLLEQARTIAIGKRYSPDQLSYYSKGHQFPSIVSSCVSAPLTSVMFPTLSKVNNDIIVVKNMFRRSVKVLTYCIYPLLFGIAAVSYNMIRFLLTDKWLPATPFLCIFCFYYLFPPIHSLNQEAIKAMGKGNELLKFGIIKRLISVIVILSTIWFNPYIIAFGTIVSAVLATIVNAYQNKKVFGYTYKEQFFDWIPNFTIGLCMFGIVFATGKLLPFNYILVLFLQVVEGIVVYFLLSFFTKNDSFIYIFKNIRLYFKSKRLRKEDEHDEIL